MSKVYSALPCEKKVVILYHPGVTFRKGVLAHWLLDRYALWILQEIHVCENVWDTYDRVLQLDHGLFEKNFFSLHVVVWRFHNWVVCILEESIHWGIVVFGQRCLRLLHVKRYNGIFQILVDLFFGCAFLPLKSSLLRITFMDGQPHPRNVLHVIIPKKNIIFLIIGTVITWTLVPNILVWILIFCIIFTNFQIYLHIFEIASEGWVSMKLDFAVWVVEKI